MELHIVSKNTSCLFLICLEHSFKHPQVSAVYTAGRCSVTLCSAAALPLLASLFILFTSCHTVKKCPEGSYSADSEGSERKPLLCRIFPCCDSYMCMSVCGIFMQGRGKKTIFQQDLNTVLCIKVRACQASVERRSRKAVWGSEGFCVQRDSHIQVYIANILFGGRLSVLAIYTHVFC